MESQLVTDAIAALELGTNLFAQVDAFDIGSDSEEFADILDFA